MSATQEIKAQQLRNATRDRAKLIDRIQRELPITWLANVHRQMMGWWRIDCPGCGSDQAQAKHKQNIWHCFECQRGGDVITFLRERDNLSFTDAVQKATAILDLCATAAKQYDV